MRWLLFLSRLAFICGIFFLLAVSLLIYDWAHDDAITSTIVMIGYVMGVLIVPFVTVSYLILLVMRRKLTTFIPLWLVIANVAFLFILLFYIFYLNDPYYHQK
jgi:hypothetical protein